MILISAPKRIHFGDETYEMRVHLAILDWVCSNAYFFSLGHLSRGQGEGKGIIVNKYIRFLFNVRMRILEEIFTQCSTISTQVILEEWPRQEF